MSDTMQPPLNNPLNTTMPAQIHSMCNQGQLVDASQAIRQSVNKYIQEGDKEKPILRIDEMPVFIGNKAELAEVFDSLVGMILQHPPAGNRLFLYIKCEADQKTNDHYFDLQGISQYKLSFHTNIVTDEGWMAKNKGQISQCNLLVLKQGGRFSFHELSNTGCLFSLSLPGKIIN